MFHEFLFPFFCFFESFHLHFSHIASEWDFYQDITATSLNQQLLHSPQYFRCLFVTFFLLRY
ncbi:CLUMA_CG004669, isoform A [Clunio marinus]|uniref:CLUMA_CG004669, isoform A n=1 Tax=Clunio marinus TaxID=568069 RepID=A0A1J1HUD6_9DIPT|nr:CLUMA_CG004669, isoform A [Clunio marinus]